MEGGGGGLYYILSPKLDEMKPSLTLFKWTLFTTLGWLLGLTLAVVGAHPFEEIGLGVAWMGAGIGAGIGFMQWIALRASVQSSSGWILHSAAGQGGVLLVLNILDVVLSKYQLGFIGDGISTIICLVIGTSLGGYLSGWWQEKYILRKQLSRTNGWPMTSLLAWLTAGVLFGIMYLVIRFAKPENGELGPLPVLFVFFSVGPTIGMITGKKIAAFFQKNN